MRLTLEIVAKCLFDADVCGRVGRRQRRDGDGAPLLHRPGRPAPSGCPTVLPTPANLRFRRAMRRLDGIIFEIIAERTASRRGPGRPALDAPAGPGPEEDGGRDDRPPAPRRGDDPVHGRPRDDRQHPGLGLVSCCRGHPEAEARLHAELDEVLADRPPTIADLPRLPYTEQVITETLRVYPTVWLLGREAIEPHRGRRLPVAAGDDHLHEPVGHPPRPPMVRRPAGLPPRPMGSTAWRGGSPDTPTSRSAAARGSASATTSPMMEAVLLLATIARRFRLRVAAEAVVPPCPTMTLRPDGGVKVVLSRRP